MMPLSSVTALAKKNSDITTIAPTPQGADALEIIKHLQQHKTGALFLARDDKRAHLIRQQLSFYAPQLQTIYIPAWDCLPYDRVSPAVHISSLRTEALCRIANLDAIDNIVVITTINSALQKLPPKSSLASRSIHFQVNKNYKRQELLNQLINAGYNRNAAAHEPGEFAVRGAIIDIIPTGSESGYRLDFFDDTLETVRIFDPLTQISKGSIKELTLAPASEIILDEPHIDNFKNNYRELFGTTSQDDMLYHAVLEGRHYPGMEHWMPLFYNEVETLFNYLPEVSTFFDHLCLEAKEERLTLIDDYYTARKESDANAGLYSSGGSYNPIPIEKFYVTDKSWSGIFNNKSNVFSFSPYNTEQAVKTHYQFTPNFLSESKAKTINCFDFFKETLP
jgi:transcription-repair coupling factor (superfamily II helicase)